MSHESPRMRNYESNYVSKYGLVLSLEFLVW